LQKKVTILLLVRHGETEWNLQQRYQGQNSRVGLNEKGREQARLTARRLAGLTLHAAYSSDLRRAQECAEIIAAPHNLEVKVLSSLRERNFGALEGLSRQEAQTRPWWREIEESEGFLAPPGGETRAEMRRRVLECMKEIIASHEGENVLIVAHGGPISQMVSDLLGGPAERRVRLRLDNCSLTVIMAEGKKRTLLLLNDVGHLFPHAPVGVLAAMEDEAKD